MKNNNRAAIRRLSSRSLKSNRLRNLFAVFAIILTSMLFTAVFSLLSGMIQAGQESTMREVGTRFHAGLKDADMQQYEKAAADPLVKRSCYDILIGFADNIMKQQAEIRYMPFEDALPDYFITLLEGHLPQAENEIVVDTLIMDELKVPYALGAKIPIDFQFMGEVFQKEFIVSGYYKSSPVSHASELFVSESFWLNLKGNHTEADFRAWNKEHPNDNSKGLLSVQLQFDNASHLEKKVRTVIENMGYEPETELDYGVNWAYMENRMESVDPFTFCIIIGALAVILLTGYLIIYNIFHISIMTDIRFYGLLKTIGTTKKQLKQLIARQVLMLSVIGIPIGLLCGYAVGILGVPLLTKITYNNQQLDVSLSPHPAIFLFGAAFSVITIFLSCRRPGKIAGSVSPIDAVKYTQVKVKARNHPKRRRFSPFSMALANLGRNKKKTSIVIASISLSIILLTLVMTGVGSFQIGQYLEARITGDFMIGGAGVFHSTTNVYNYELDKKFADFAEEQPGIEQTDELWLGTGKYIKLDEEGKARLLKLDQEDKLDHSFGLDPLKKDTISGDVYGYTDGLFKNITVLEGSLDIEKFQNGDYILLKCFYGKDTLGPEDSLYHPGDKITIQSFTKDSTAEEIKDESGETIDIVYDNLAEKEYEVMAIVSFPHSMDLTRAFPNGMDAVLPLKELTDPDAQNNFCFAKSYQISDEHKASFNDALKDYTENVDPLMGYVSKPLLEAEFSGVINMISIIGSALAGVIAFIGILNFINTVFTGIISRKQEFAMLQSIGMTTAQLKCVIICEGICYVLIAGVLSFAAGSILAYIVLNAVNNIILFFEYQFQILPFLIMLPILLAVAAVTPMICFWKIQKESVVERLRTSE